MSMRVDWMRVRKIEAGRAMGLRMVGGEGGRGGDEAMVREAGRRRRAGCLARGLGRVVRQVGTPNKREKGSTGHAIWIEYVEG